LFFYVTLKSNAPLHLKKLSGFPSVKAFTVIVFAPAETLLLSLLLIVGQKTSLRLDGNCTSISSAKGSMVNLPDFCGYKTAF
jgi:hypothetical protein